MSNFHKLEDPFEPFQIVSSIIKPYDPKVAFGLLILALLLLLSALVSGSEVAFFSLKKKDTDDLKKSENRNDTSIITLLRSPKKLLATILIANNFINVAIIILSSILIEKTLDFSLYPKVGFVFQVILVTFLILLVGEIIPKVYATQSPIKLLHIMAIPAVGMFKLFSPLSYLLTSMTKVIDKRFVNRSDGVSVDELSHALDLAKDETVDEEDHKILKGIVKFGNTSVKQIMTSRVDVVSIDLSSTYDEILKKILESGYSRIPVCEDSLDQVKGVLYIKDLLPYLTTPKLSWKKLVRPAFFVPENKKIDDLLKEFQEKKIHIAIVVDEYGGSSGLVSLEDIMEEIVGEISDEFDDEDIVYSKLDEDNYLFQGKVLLNDFYKVIGIEGHYFEENKGESDTLAGFIIEIGNKIPKKNESIKFRNYTLIIESADNRKINTIKVNIGRSNPIKE